MTIDVHAHAIVPAALEEMASAHPDHGPELVTNDDKRYLDYPGRANLGPLPAAIFEPELRLQSMSEQRVDLQVIAVPPPNFHYHVPAAIGRDFAVIQNDALLALSETRPDRFNVFAALPLQDVDASLAEMQRVAAYQVVRGVQIGTNIDGRDLDDPTLHPVWDLLQALDMPVWLHPDQRAIAGADRLGDFYLQNLVGLPIDTTIAVARLIFGGVIDRFPDLRFGFVHGGGFSPYQIGRWDHGWSMREEPKSNIGDTQPGDYYKRLYFDSLTHDPASLRLLGERVGWDHVLLGSDYPFDMASTDPVGAVEQAGIGEEPMEKVLEKNAHLFLRGEQS